MLYFVYVLYSQRDKKLYVGCTNNISRRITQHNHGSVLATKNRRPLVVIHSEHYKNKGDAFQRERFLKSLWGARTKKKILQEYLDKVGRQ